MFLRFLKNSYRLEYASMNIYTLLRFYRVIKSPRLKLLGFLCLHILHKRYLYILIDPSLSCNLRCRLCFFSDPDYSAATKGFFTQEDIHALANSVFHRGIKIQIGCGAEPMTYSRLHELVKLAHDKGIKNISITTNGSLLTQEKLKQLVDNGLNEIVLSAHGLTKERYEYMMRGANYEHFLRLLNDIAAVKKEHPDLLFRINYTVCEDNIEDLKELPMLFSDNLPNVIQLRPVQDIGSTAYDNYSMSSVLAKYEECIMTVVHFCESNNITCIYPNKSHLSVIDEENRNKEHLHAVVDMLPCFYLLPYANWKDAFNPYEETFEAYSKRTHRIRNWLKMFLSFNKSAGQEKDSVTHSLNYVVK